MTRPPSPSPWLANAWLLVLAVPLAGAGMFGAERFVSAVAWLYMRLPVHAAAFRDDLALQTRVLHALAGPAALAAIAAWLIASSRGVRLARWIAGTREGETGRELWRRRVLTALVAYSIALLPVRLARDGLREEDLAGRSFEERRLRVYGLHTPEPDYVALEAFRRGSNGAGAVLVLRTGRWLDFSDVFAASYLFPQRVYVARAPGCSAEDAARAAARRPEVRWLQFACAGGSFAPRPVGPP